METATMQGIQQAMLRAAWCSHLHFIHIHLQEHHAGVFITEGDKDGPNHAAWTTPAWRMTTLLGAAKEGGDA